MDRVKIIGCGYRFWAINIFDLLLRGELNAEVTIIRIPEKVSLEAFEEYAPDLVLFYGWDWPVPQEIIDKYMCLCLHPSPLPKYRGGNPLQHQIMNGEVTSAVSIFRMNGSRDAGDLCAQERMSLEGGIWDIFSRMSNIGGALTVGIVKALQDGNLRFWSQEGETTYFEPLKVEDSEITRDELKHGPARYLYNKIRSLQDPFDNAFVLCPDGEKLYLTEAHCE